MADLGAVHDVGESIALLLQRRRALLAAQDLLGTVPASETILHRPIGEIAGSSAPSSGLSITCFHVGYSEHNLKRTAARDPSVAHGISLELRYLLASWSATASAELAFLSWAMLELARYPTLDRSLLINPDHWGRDETLQIVAEDAQAEDLFRVWEAMKQRHRLSALFRVRIVRIGYGAGADGPPVVASRLEFASGEPASVAIL